MKISEVFRKRTLFGVAIFCIAAIAAVGALSTGGNKKEDAPDSLVDLNETGEPEENRTAEEPQVAQKTEEGQKLPQAEVAEKPEETQKPEPQEPSQITEKPEETIKPQVQVSEQTQDTPKEPEQAEVLSPQLIAEQLSFDKSGGLLWPVSGEVVIPYSPEHGVFYQTLEQFRVSDAVVLSSQVGAEVKAAAKGVVTSIEEDVRTGTMVTLALGNDVSLVYGQVEPVNIKEGDVIEAGECIGTVAEPTRYYVVEGPNLYFQVLEGEASIDPTELLVNE